MNRPDTAKFGDEPYPALRCLVYRPAKAVFGK